MRRFRAWHTKLNRYLKDDEFYIRCDGKVCADADGNGYEEAFDTIDFDNGYIIREDDTGFKDKNGKEIYEGDIVEYTTCYYGNEKRHRKVVEWEEWDSDDFGEPHNLGYFDLSEGMEIVGNIHENPELLEEEE